MKFGLIIFTLCLLPFVASEARSEDKRIAPNLKAEDKYIESYKHCIDKNFDLFFFTAASGDNCGVYHLCLLGGSAGLYAIPY